MWISHDGRILNFSIFAEHLPQILLTDLLSKTSHEKVGAWILVFALATVSGRSVRVTDATVGRGATVSGFTVTAVAAR